MQDDARGLLDELKYIPKEIQLLKEDMEATDSFAVSKTLKTPKITTINTTNKTIKGGTFND